MTGERDPLSDRLEDGRPVPRAGFRASLRRQLVAFGPPPARPRRLGRLVAVHAGAGALLLAVAAASVAGLGPLG